MEFFSILDLAIINMASALLAAFVAREKAPALQKRRMYFAWLGIAAITGPLGLIATVGLPDRSNRTPVV